MKLVLDPPVLNISIITDPEEPNYFSVSSRDHFFDGVWCRDEIETVRNYLDCMLNGIRSEMFLPVIDGGPSIGIRAHVQKPDVFTVYSETFSFNAIWVKRDVRYFHLGLDMLLAGNLAGLYLPTIISIWPASTAGQD